MNRWIGCLSICLVAIADLGWSADQTVECTTADCSAALNSAIAAAFNSGGGWVYLKPKTGTSVITTIQPGTSITLRSGVHISSIGTVRIDVEDNSAPIFVSGIPVTNASVNRLQIYLKPSTATTVGPVIRLGAPFTNFKADDLTVWNGRGNRTFLTATRGGSVLTVTNNTVKSLDRFVWLPRDSAGSSVVDGVTIARNVVEKVAHSAVYISGAHKNITIDDNTFEWHLTGGVTSHMIATDGSTYEDPDGVRHNSPARVWGFHLTNNRIYGRPNVAKYRLPNGQWATNGASGDLVAIRFVDYFTFIGNTVTDSGEVGLTLSDGSINGTVTGNHFKRTDTAAIVVGSGLVERPGIPAPLPISGITIAGNDIVDFSLDRSGQLHELKTVGNPPNTITGPAHDALSAIRVWNAQNITLNANEILGFLDPNANKSGTSGIWIWDNSTRNVLNLSMTGNTFGTWSPRVGTIVQSPVTRQLPVAAGVNGGTNWTGSIR